MNRQFGLQKSGKLPPAQLEKLLYGQPLPDLNRSAKPLSAGAQEALQTLERISATKTAQFVLITPETAQRWLDESNTGNRPKRGWWLEALRAAMLRGEWVTTHQGIAFSASGRLLDGQHRLHAIVKSGMSIMMLVVRGVDEAAFGVIDTGVKRSISDLTGLPKRTAEAARFAAHLVYGGSVTSTQAAAIAAAGVAEVHEELMDCCGKAKAYYGSAPMRMAAITLVMDGNAKEHIFKVYADLVHEKFGELPTVAHSLIRQVNAGTTRASMTPAGFTAFAKCCPACGKTHGSSARSVGVAARCTTDL